MAEKKSPPFVNGNRFGWASIVLALDGVEFDHFIAVAYTASQEVGKVRGRGHRKLGRTKGESDNEGSFTLIKKEANALIKLLGPGFMTGKKDFSVTVSYSETGEDVIITDELISCRVINMEDTREPGTDAAAVQFNIDIGRTLYDGVDPQE